MTQRGVISIDQLDDLVERNPNIRNGCLLDTNILISASLPIDPKNDVVENLITKFSELKVPLYSNVNIRAEFLEIQRRVLIPEILIEFYESEADLDDVLTRKLRSVQTSYRKALNEKRLFKLSDQMIKEFRALLSRYKFGGKDGWAYLCEKLLAPQLSSVWDDVVRICNLNFIKIRAGENNPMLISKVSWDGVTRIMGNHGIGSADAMILNLLICSKIVMVATADIDIRSMSSFLQQNEKIAVEV